MPKPIIQIRTTDGETRTVINDYSTDFSVIWGDFLDQIRDGTGAVKVARLGVPNKVAYIPVRHITQFWEGTEDGYPRSA